MGFGNAVQAAGMEPHAAHQTFWRRSTSGVQHIQPDEGFSQIVA